MKYTLYTNEMGLKSFEDGETFMATGTKDHRNNIPFAVSFEHLFFTHLNYITVDTGSDANFDWNENGEELPLKEIKEEVKPQLVDRGTDCVILINGEDFRVDHLSPVQFVDLLNRKGLADIETVSFSEYEKSK